MNMAEATALLGVAGCTVGRLIRDGELVATKAGPSRGAPYEISRDSVVAFLASQKVWPRPQGFIPRPVHERAFARLVIDPSGCLLWTGSLNEAGYAHIRVGGQRSPEVFVHRLMYEHFIGPIPDGLVIDHLCRVRHCAAPAHLEAVTQGENVRRSWHHRPAPRADERTREMWRRNSVRYRARRKAAR